MLSFLLWSCRGEWTAPSSHSAAPGQVLWKWTWRGQCTGRAVFPSCTTWRTTGRGRFGEGSSSPEMSGFSSKTTKGLKSFRPARCLLRHLPGSWGLFFTSLFWSLNELSCYFSTQEKIKSLVSRKILILKILVCKVKISKHQWTASLLLKRMRLQTQLRDPRWRREIDGFPLSMKLMFGLLVAVICALFPHWPVALQPSPYLFILLLFRCDGGV